MKVATRNKMDAPVSAKIYTPVFKPAEMADEQKRENRAWLFRRLVDLGVIEMANAPKPTGWSINPTTITTLITIMLFLGGLCAFLWNTAYKQGQLEAERIAAEQRYESEKKQILERLEKAEADSKKAKELQLANGAGEAGHDDKPKKEKK